MLKTPAKVSLLQLHFAVFLFGFTGLFGKWLTLSPLVIVFGRVTFAFVALLLVQLFIRQDLRLKTKAHAGILFLLSVLFIVHWGTFFASIQVSRVAICLLSFSTAPIFTVLLEPLFFAGHTLKAKDVGVAVVVTAGVALAVPSWHIGDSQTQGVLLGIVSGLAIALVTLLNRAIMGQYPAFVIIFYQLGGIMVLLLPLMLVTRPMITSRDLGLLALLGVVFTAFTQLLFVQSMKNVPARLASLVNTGMEVVYGVALAALLVHEIPNARTLAGGALIIGATVYATKDHHEQELLLNPV